jgi:hypothetical protein
VLVTVSRSAAPAHVLRHVEIAHAIQDLKASSPMPEALPFLSLN